MNYVYGIAVASAASVIVATAIAQTVDFVFRAMGEVYQFRRKEEWKKDVLDAWRR